MVSLRNNAETTGYPHTKVQSWTRLSHRIKKNNSKWINEINIRAKTITLLEENIGVNLMTLDLVMAS